MRNASQHGRLALEKGAVNLTSRTPHLKERGIIMAKLSEYLARVFADSNIEIPDSSTIEQKPEEKTPETPKETETQTPPAPATDTTPKVNYEAEYAKLQARVKELEDANFKLIKNLPVQEDVKSVEQMIYESVHGVRGDVKNANGNTSSGT